MTVRDYQKRQTVVRKKAEVKYTRMIVSSIKEAMSPLFTLLNSNHIDNLDSKVDYLISSKPIETTINHIYVKFGAKIANDFVKLMPIRGQKSVVDWEEILYQSFRAKAAKKVTEIVGTTKELAKTVIRNNLAMANDGASIDAISANIKSGLTDVGGPISAGRARTIARTEVIGSANFATHESATSLGLDLEHKWVTGGANIRESHLSAEAEDWKPVDEGWYLSGVEMMHPSDPNGLPGEVINCKCVEIFRVK